MRNFVLTVIFVFLAVCPSGAQSVNAQKNRKAKLEKEIAQLETQLKRNVAKSNDALNRLTLVHKQISSRKVLIEGNEKDLMHLEDSMRLCQHQLDSVKARLEALTMYYGNLVRTAYKNRNSRVWYMYLLASDNLKQAARRYGYMRNLSSQMQTQGEKIIAARQELQARQMQLDSMRFNARSIRDANADALKGLEKDEAMSKQLVRKLQSNKNWYQKQLASKKKQVEALNREIERLIAAEIANQNQQNKSSKKKVDYKLDGEFASNRGKLPWPVEGTVVGSFGQHSHPVYKSVVMPFNNGVNIATSPNATVRAVFSGEVKNIIVMPGYDKCVLVQHGNFFTFYCKMSSVSVKTGQSVSTSQAIGTVATIGDETQFHFQLWQGRSPQDPEKWLRP